MVQVVYPLTMVLGPSTLAVQKRSSSQDGSDSHSLGWEEVPVGALG